MYILFLYASLAKSFLVHFSIELFFIDSVVFFYSMLHYFLSTTLLFLTIYWVWFCHRLISLWCGCLQLWFFLLELPWLYARGSDTLCYYFHLILGNSSFSLQFLHWTTVHSNVYCSSKFLCSFSVCLVLWRFFVVFFVGFLSLILLLVSSFVLLWSGKIKEIAFLPLYLRRLFCTWRL